MKRSHNPVFLLARNKVAAKILIRGSQTKQRKKCAHCPGDFWNLEAQNIGGIFLLFSSKL